MKIITSVHLLATPDDREVFVPVSLEGQRKYMLLDTGGALDQITPQAAAALGRPQINSTSGAALAAPTPGVLMCLQHKSGRGRI